MTELAAIRTALGLLHLPSSVRSVRSEPLPAGLDQLLRVASGDEQVAAELAERTERPQPVIHSAAIFFIEQILLSPDADCYRVLGATPATPVQDLRRNMALLMSWLHPDKGLSGERAVFTARVTEAWDTLRNPERKSAYDAALAARETNLAERAEARRAHAIPAAGRSNRPSESKPDWPRARDDNVFRRALRLLQSKGRP